MATDPLRSPMGGITPTPPPARPRNPVWPWVVLIAMSLGVFLLWTHPWDRIATARPRPTPTHKVTPAKKAPTLQQQLSVVKGENHKLRVKVGELRSVNKGLRKQLADAKGRTAVKSDTMKVDVRHSGGIRLEIVAPTAATFPVIPAPTGK